MAAKIYQEPWGGMRIEYTPAAGPFAGKTLRGGYVCGVDHVRFDAPGPKQAGPIARPSTNPELVPLVAELNELDRAKKARIEESRRQSDARTAAYEQTEDGKAKRVAIDQQNEIEADLKRSAREYAEHRREHPLPASRPTDDDIRSLEGNEDL